MNTDIVGKGWSFPLQLGLQGKLVGLTSEQNEIEQAIRIILGTHLGERVMRPEFGCRIHELVFAPNNKQTAILAERYVEAALVRWEPRIELVSVLASPAYDKNDYSLMPASTRQNLKATLQLHIRYIIKATDDPRSLVFPFYLIPEEMTG